MDPIYNKEGGKISPVLGSQSLHLGIDIKEINLRFTAWNLKGNIINIINMEQLTPIIGRLIENLDNDMSWEDARMEAIKEYCILEHPDFDLSTIPYVLENQPNYFRIYHTIIELEKTGIIKKLDRDKKIGKLLE
jgi:hypothetical protein